MNNCWIMSMSNYKLNIAIATTNRACQKWNQSGFFKNKEYSATRRLCVFAHSHINNATVGFSKYWLSAACIVSGNPINQFRLLSYFSVYNIHIQNRHIKSCATAKKTNKTMNSSNTQIQINASEWKEHQVKTAYKRSILCNVLYTHYT